MLRCSNDEVRELKCCCCCCSGYQGWILLDCVGTVCTVEAITSLVETFSWREQTVELIALLLRPIKGPFTVDQLTKSHCLAVSVSHWGRHPLSPSFNSTDVWDKCSRRSMEPINVLNRHIDGQLRTPRTPVGSVYTSLWSLLEGDIPHILTKVFQTHISPAKFSNSSPEILRCSQASFDIKSPGSPPSWTRTEDLQRKILIRCPDHLGTQRNNGFPPRSCISEACIIPSMSASAWGVCCGPGDADFVIRGCMCWLCADIHVPLTCCDRVDSSALLSMWPLQTPTSKLTPDSHMNGTERCRWRPQLSTCVLSGICWTLQEVLGETIHRWF